MTRFAALNPFQTLFYSCNVSGVGPTSGFYLPARLSLASSHCKSSLWSQWPIHTCPHSIRLSRSATPGGVHDTSLLYRLANDLDPRKCVPLINGPGLTWLGAGDPNPSGQPPPSQLTYFSLLCLSKCRLVELSRRMMPRPLSYLRVMATLQS